MAVHFQSEGYHAITPYIAMKGAAAAIEFYKKAFGAVEKMRIPGPDGIVGHAELIIGDSIIMLADECEKIQGPLTVGGTPCVLMLYIEDVDGVVAKAVELGATLKQEVADQFYGDRTGSIIDPFGHHWAIATHIEDVSPEECAKRAAALHGS